MCGAVRPYTVKINITRRSPELKDSSKGKVVGEHHVYSTLRYTGISKSVSSPLRIPSLTHPTNYPTLSSSRRPPVVAISMSAAVTNQDVAGTWRGAGGLCAPSCVTLSIHPACAGGTVVIQSCWGLPLGPCFFACKCGEDCWYHGSNYGMKFTGKDKLDMDCGTFSREGGGPPVASMAR